MQQSQQSQNGTNNQNGEDKQPGGKAIWTRTNTAIAIQVFLICSFFLWFFIPDYVEDRSQAAKTFIESEFSLAIVIVIIVHAFMYYKQAREAKKGVDIAERQMIHRGVRQLAESPKRRRTASCSKS